jgi:hypothetical protein
MSGLSHHHLKAHHKGPSAAHHATYVYSVFVCTHLEAIQSPSLSSLFRVSVPFTTGLARFGSDDLACMRSCCIVE